ncbi:hypothetical protein ACWGLF_45605 [Streptomyces puniciscabiei]
MNSERFEERLMHALKNHVQQRAQKVGVEVTAGVRPVRSRRAGWVSVGLAAGLAVAAAATAFSPGQSASSVPGGGLANPPRGAHSLGPITNAAYTLEEEPTGEIKLTIVDPSGKLNIKGMQRDLARMGVRAKVLLGAPHCPSPQSTAPAAGVRAFGIAREHGKLVAYIDPAKFPADTTLAFGFPLGKTGSNSGLDGVGIGVCWPV